MQQESSLEHRVQHAAVRALQARQKALVARASRASSPSRGIPARAVRATASAMSLSSRDSLLDISASTASPVEHAGPRLVVDAADAPVDASTHGALPSKLELFDRGAERARGRSPHGHGEIELIGKLKGLLDGGAITEAIFNAKRAELLARI